MKFIDSVKITVASGNGGSGCASFCKEAYRPRGGPDGGHGGKGGDVYIKVNRQLTSLMNLHGKKRLVAKNGQPGSGSHCEGARGADLVIEVPPGTLVKDEDHQILLDLQEGEERFLEGGRGGKGNSFFKTSVNQAPRHFQTGESGIEKVLHFELQLIADVGIIGFPNAGKSTLISALTSAKPKIADYPFTTLQPQLGVVKVDDSLSFTVADIPGLIEGASEGQGLGLQFLRHVERTRFFVHMVDVSDFSNRDPWDDFQKINAELTKYDLQISKDRVSNTLSERPQIVVLSKWDATTADRMDEIESQFLAKKIKVLKISSVSHKNLQELINKMSLMLKEIRNG